MKIGITSESAIDLPNETLQKLDIATVPLTILLGDDVIYDDNMVAEKIFEFVRKTNILPKTSAVNEEQYKELFSKQLEKYDVLIHLALGSDISSCCQNAIMAAKNFDGKVYVVDTRNMSTAIALLALYAKKLIELNLDVNEIVKRLEKAVPNTEASAVLKDLTYLYKGGRCSLLKLFGANLLKIRPQIIVKEGKLGPHHRYRGQMEKVVANYCKDTLETFNTPDLENAFVTYTTASDEMIDIAKKSLENAGFKNVYVTHAGGTISSHCGETCLGILFINDEHLYDGLKK